MSKDHRSMFGKQLQNEKADKIRYNQSLKPTAARYGVRPPAVPSLLNCRGGLTLRYPATLRPFGFEGRRFINITDVLQIRIGKQLQNQKADKVRYNQGMKPTAAQYGVGPSAVPILLNSRGGLSLR